MNKTTKTNLFSNIKHKVYYAHSIRFYNTQTETSDIEFLKTLKYSKIINPNGLNLGKSMQPYLLTIQKCDLVWYRGSTIGVVQEVLTALALNKAVYSLETKDLMSHSEISNFIVIFNDSLYSDPDKRLILSLFGKSVYKTFLRILEGDFP